MSERLFGTDGFRRPYDASQEPDLMNAATLARMAYAHVEELRDEQQGTPILFVGGDIRSSGYELRHAVMRGAAAAGADVRNVGIAPTPVIAWLAQYYGVGAVSVTASHNPDTDNGFKPFKTGGTKYGREQLDRIEQRYRALGNQLVAEQANDLRIHHSVQLRQTYLDIMQKRLGGPEALAGRTVALDCANGAALEMAPRLFESLGARVVRFACKENPGDLINDGCGATHLDALQGYLTERPELTASAGFMGGLAFDGDADRVLGVSRHGSELNGNHFMDILADTRQKGIVGTVYTNTALRRAVEARGVEFHECKNGDSYVTERLTELTNERGPGYSHGGESTGHLIKLEHLHSGDGMFMGAWLLTRLAQQGIDMDDVARNLPLWPERMHNVRFEGANAKSVAESDSVRQRKAELEQRYQNGLHIVLRPSGTQPLIRVWAESEDPRLVDEAVDSLSEALLTAA